MFLFEIKLLQKGDILLVAQNSLSSKTIRLTTGCAYSHAMLYVGGGSFIHSDQLGVHSGNIHRLLLEEKGHGLAIRVTETTDFDKVITYARSEVGKQYSIRDAVSSKLTAARQRSNRQFCSRLVALAFEYGGLSLAQESEYCSPGDLLDSAKTKHVSNCVRAATESEVQFANSPSPLNVQTRITNSILASARDISGQDIQRFSDIDSLVISEPSLDSRLTSVMHESGYLTMWQFDIKENAWRYDPTQFLALPIHASEKLELAKSEAESAQEQLEQYSTIHSQYLSLCSRYPRQYLQTQREVYQRLVEWMVKRDSAARVVIKTLESIGYRMMIFGKLIEV
ncbi:MAG: hypothetical protein MJA83_20545 [Gammaproteobacteria bacterium]|nr:hypothetical protein [Gammaproteobacteria bacterium]